MNLNLVRQFQSFNSIIQTKISILLNSQTTKVTQKLKNAVNGFWEHFSRDLEWNWKILTPKGSAFSHEIWEPQLAGRNFSGRDSGTATSMKRTSSTATAVASHITSVSLYNLSKYAPIAGLVTRLAAKVAETYSRKEKWRCQEMQLAKLIPHINAVNINGIIEIIILYCWTNWSSKNSAFDRLSCLKSKCLHRRGKNIIIFHQLWHA